MNEAFRLNYAIKFQLERRNEKDTQGKPVPILSNLPIQMVITFLGIRLKLYTGYRIDAAKFEVTSQRVNPKCTNEKKETGSAINKDLNKLETAISKAFDVFKLKEAIPTADDIKKVFNDAQGKSPVLRGSSFFDVFDQFIIDQGKENSWTNSTVKKLTTVKNTLFEFDEKLTFASFDKIRLQSYIDFLRSPKSIDKIKTKVTGKNYRNSTIAKQLKFIRWFLRWALRNKHNVELEALEYRPKLTKGTKGETNNVVFFSLDELKHLRDFDPQKDYLTRVKNVFLFCAFTSLRYSDVFNLKRNDIKKDSIEVTTQKTDDALIIQLNEHSKAILDIYKDVEFEDGKALPVISNQKMCKYLKELCKLAGFDTPIKTTYYIGNQRIEEVRPKWAVIGTHTARRSFISNAVALGIPVETIIEWTGHRDFKAMYPYLKIEQKTKKKEMDKFNF